MVFSHKCRLNTRYVLSTVYDTNRKNQVYCSDKCLHSNYSSSIGEAVFFLNQYIEDIFNSAC